MNKCLLGSVIFGWFAGIKESESIKKSKDGISHILVQIKLEAGNTIGNKSKVEPTDVKYSKLINVETSIEDLKEILSGIKRVNKYYKHEFVDKNTVSDQMISILDNYYNSNNIVNINYAKSMSCFGVEIAPRSYLKDVINIDAIDNNEINNISSDFLIIKLIEDKFLKNLMSGSYISKGHEYKTKILSDNTVLIAIPITQIKEVLKNINNFLKNKI
jgi:hypothetical protein